jgi:hypothetical protein
MNIQKFLQLNSVAQSNLLYHHAIYIGKRKKGATIVILYQLESFYVEIFYEKYRYKILSKKCFTTTDILDHYPETICLEELV